MRRGDRFPRQRYFWCSSEARIKRGAKKTEEIQRTTWNRSKRWELAFGQTDHKKGRKREKRNIYFAVNICRRCRRTKPKTRTKSGSRHCNSQRDVFSIDIFYKALWSCISFSLFPLFETIWCEKWRYFSFSLVVFQIYFCLAWIRPPAKRRTSLASALRRRTLTKAQTARENEANENRKRMQRKKC